LKITGANPRPKTDDEEPGGEEGRKRENGLQGETQPIQGSLYGRKWGEPGGDSGLVFVRHNSWEKFVDRKLRGGGEGNFSDQG